jgi:hypothetical protein
MAARRLEPTNGEAVVAKTILFTGVTAVDGHTAAVDGVRRGVVERGRTGANIRMYPEAGQASDKQGGLR